MIELDLMQIPIDERLLKKSGAQFKGRVLKDKDNKVEVQIEREKGMAPLENGQQCILATQFGVDKGNFLERAIIDLLTKVIGVSGADGRLTKTAGFAELRPYARVCEAIQLAVEGKAQMDLEDLQYLQRNFSRLQTLPSPDGTRMLLAINDWLVRETNRAVEQTKNASK